MTNEELCTLIKERLGRRETEASNNTPGLYFEAKSAERASFEARLIQRYAETKDRALLGFLCGLAWRGNCATVEEAFQWMAEE